MTFAAGQKVRAIELNKLIRRIATTNRTTTPSTFTAETVTDTVSADLVTGRTYGIWWFAQCQSSVANDQVGIKIREDSVSGTILANQRAPVLVSSGTAYPIAQYVEFVAVSTANKTFVGTMVRSVGTGNITAGASANQQATIYVEYVSG